MSRERFGYPFPLTLLLPAVFLSGTAALVYEIVWARHLSLIFGSTTEAVAAVLSSFMLGLALGAVLVGQLADRSRHPLRWAAVLEIGIGVYALSFTSLIEIAGDRLPGPAWIQAFLLLILPCVLMGGTLPVLARAAADSPTRGAKALGALYGVNTLGAVAGAILATFVLLESLGLSGATIFAACINIGLGILFWVASRAAGERTLIEAPDQPSRGLKGSAGTGVLVAFFIAGFAGLTLEVAWVRVLVYYLEGFTIAFGLMLATYLLGLGLGAIGGTALATSSKNPRRLLTRILLLEAVLAIFTFILSDRLNEPLESLRSGLGAADAMGAKYAFGLFLASAAIIVPPTLCAGALMPIIARMALCTPQEVGKQAGAVYAAGTLGAVCAPPVAAFLLIPWLGVPGAIAASAALLLWAAWLVALGGSQRDRVTATAVGVLFVVVCLLADLGRPLVEASSVLRNPKYPRHLIEFKEGAHCGVSVVEDLPSGTLALYVDGFRAAETGPKYGYMRMLGHLPVLLHNKPERVLVIAFGTGTTAGAVSVHPEVKEIVCVEIEQGVFDVAHHFEAVNRGVLNSGRATAVVADGREYVRRAGEKFDVITLEPLMPYTPAAVYLYTREFYEAAKQRLRPGGILCQWIPIHGESRDDFKRLLKSMDAAFDHVSLWFFEQSAVVLGSKRPPTPDFISLARRCQQPEVAADLRLAFVGDALHLLGSHVAAGERLSKSLKDVEPMTDNRTVLEYRPLPRRFGKRSYRYKAENLEYLRDLHAAE
ncbi:MAG: fused MFS/spermidine synthase, partial [Planctomycetota bacterium]|nr:fused MFS/spermidine synthase [Planctomycetota bacterium]